MGDRARVVMYITTNKNKGHQERVVKRSEAFLRRSKKESQLYAV
jgi:hypothetical protein